MENNLTANPMVFFATLGVAVAIIGGIVKFSRWTARVDEKLDSFTRFMDEIRSKIERIFDRLPPPPVIEGASPIRLTDLGKSVSREINGKEWAKFVAPNLLEKIKGKNPYEIQEYCLKYVNARFAQDDKLRDEIQNCAYGKGINAESVRKVLAVELRDELMKIALR